MAENAPFCTEICANFFFTPAAPQVLFLYPLQFSDESYAPVYRTCILSQRFACVETKQTNFSYSLFPSFVLLFYRTCVTALSL